MKIIHRPSPSFTGPRCTRGRLLLTTAGRDEETSDADDTTAAGNTTAMKQQQANSFGFMAFSSEGVWGNSARRTPVAVTRDFFRFFFVSENDTDDYDRRRFTRSFFASAHFPPPFRRHTHYRDDARLRRSGPGPAGFYTGIGDASCVTHAPLSHDGSNRDERSAASRAEQWPRSRVTLTQ